MLDLIQRALEAKRESKYIEFKESFDPASSQDWCETIKDIVAIANSGGGIILFGVKNTGIPTQNDLSPLLRLDPADIANRISKYTSTHVPEVEVLPLPKDNKNVFLFHIHPSSTPIVFIKPGTYASGFGKQKSAFSVGSVYFRHGAKSEPGNTDDIRKALGRQLEVIRKSWMKGVRKVVQAPSEAQIVAVMPKAKNHLGKTIAGFRVVDDPSAPAVRLTRNRDKAAGIFVHEELSNGIFDEINNVIDANTVLTRNLKQFIFGQSVYYRIYAERKHVRQNQDIIELLARTAIMQFYSPGLFWLLNLPPRVCGEILANLYRNPKNPHVHTLLRIGILLGKDFSNWLFDKWQRKWHNNPQPPTFFWTFKRMINRMDVNNKIPIALRLSPTAPLSIRSVEPSITVNDLLKTPTNAANLLSQTCILVFEGKKDQRSVARQLDYIAYGDEIEKRAVEIAQAVLDLVGSEEAGELIDD